MGEPKHILIVRDEQFKASQLERWLNRHGCVISNATTVRQAEAILRQRGGPENEDGVHLILLEPSLPGEDGMVLLPRVKIEHPDIAVIVFTAIGYADDLAQQAIELGADDFLWDTLGLECLLRQIRKALHKEVVAA